MAVFGVDVDRVARREMAAVEVHCSPGPALKFELVILAVGGWSATLLKGMILQKKQFLVEN